MSLHDLAAEAMKRLKNVKPEYLQYQLPADYDIAAECKDTSCEPCKAFCKSPCAAAYFRSVECYAHFKPIRGEEEAREGCLIHMIQCVNANPKHVFQA